MRRRRGCTPGCGEIVGECTGTVRTISDLLGMTCATVGAWEYEEEFELAEDAVTLEGAEVRVALRPDEVGPLLGRDLAVGTTLGRVSARTYTGVGSGADDAQEFVVDGDFGTRRDGPTASATRATGGRSARR